MSVFGRCTHKQLNPAAIQLYKDHNIDLYTEPLQIAVSAQHNNGGLAADIWWESVNIHHLFPVGEVNGSHGAARPGGTALNSGQVGAFRAAQKIAFGYQKKTLDLDSAQSSGKDTLSEILSIIDTLTGKPPIPDCDREYKREFQVRMSKQAAAIRNSTEINMAISEAVDQQKRFSGLKVDPWRLPNALKLRHMVFGHRMYLEAISDYLHKGGGSRASSLVASNNNEEGRQIHPLLSDWRIIPENTALRQKVQHIRWNPQSGTIKCQWIPTREIPQEESWFETIWAHYLDRTVFK